MQGLRSGKKQILFSKENFKTFGEGSERHYFETHGDKVDRGPKEVSEMLHKALTED